MEFYNWFTRLLMILFSIVFLYTSSLFLISHFSTYQQRHVISNYSNAVISYGQKNGGFADVSKQSHIGSDQRQRASFVEWNRHLLTSVYDVKIDLEITISTPYGSSTAKYDGRTRSLSQDFNESALNKRLNRGEEFTVIVKPKYIRFKFIPPKIYRVNGKPIVQKGKAHGYIKSTD